MKLAVMRTLWFCCLLMLSGLTGRASVVFQANSPYHQIRVVDEQGIRILSFNGTMETRMSLRNPLAGHFEYTEYFHMPFLWNPDIQKVLMLGLGGGSVQRAYQVYHPKVEIETVELDPVVVEVAKKFFGVTENNQHEIHTSDARVFLRRTREQYDAILIDAYTRSRYGSFIPYHLATREFFEIANEHLTENGVVAYNVMGKLGGWRGNVVAALYRTMQSVFPHVYLFPASDSMNVVLIASKSQEAVSAAMLQKKADEMVRTGRMRLPSFRQRVRAFRQEAPPGLAQAPVLTDDFAPIDGLLSR